MTEKPFDGTVSMQYEYMDDSKVQDSQLTLPTTVSCSTPVSSMFCPSCFQEI